MDGNPRIAELIVVLVATAIGCSVLSHTAMSEEPAPAPLESSKIDLSVFFDRYAGARASLLTDREIGQRNQVGAYMERRLIHRLNKAGFNARTILSRREFKQGPRKFLLVVIITDYLGRGVSAELSTRYRLFGGDEEPLWDASYDSRTRRRWEKCVVQTNTWALRDLEAAVVNLPDDELNYEPVPEVNGPVETTDPMSTRLHRLEHLKNEGQLSEGEYQAKRKQILDEL